MPKKQKLTLEAYKETNEYKFWLHIENLCNEYGLSGDNYITRKDLGGFFWEPLWDRIYKFGVLLKHAPKSIKYIKGEWMRPLLYLESQSQDIMTYDGFSFKVNKPANASAINLRFALKRLLDSLCNASKMTEETFAKDYKTMKEDDKYFFKNLNAYVKEGYRAMHENVKFLLEPLRLLRKGGYRLFSYEQQLDRNIDLNLFKDKNRYKVLVKNVSEQFKMEDLMVAKNNNIEELEKIMGRETNQHNLRYTFDNKKLEIKNLDQNPYASIALKSNEQGKNNKNANSAVLIRNPKKEHMLTKKKLEQQQKALKEKEMREVHKLVYPNLSDLKTPEPREFEKEALIVDFEKGFKAMLIYLNQRFITQIPEIIDPHKIFVNLKNIDKKYVCTAFFMKRLEDSLYDLKKMCYEMKLNGLNRVLLPLSANIEFTTQVKIVYDNQVCIEKLMGDKLKLEQFLFVYNQVDFISHSGYHEELTVIKDKTFMENSVSKFIFYQALCHSVEVMLKMRKLNRQNEIKYDTIDNFFQTTKLSLDAIDEYNSVNFYNFDDYVPEITKSYSTEIKNQIKTDKLILEKEIKNIGRFFILENFICPNEKENYIDLVTQLIEINDSVREDIRDYFLLPESKKKEKISKINTNNLNPEEQNENIQNTDQSYQDMTKRKNSIRNTDKHPSKRYKRQSSKLSSGKVEKIRSKRREGTSNSKNMNISQESFYDFSNEKIKKLKPPFVWNFPIGRMRELQKKKDVNSGKDEINKNYVDFGKIYVDGRVQKFLELYEMVFNNSMNYCKLTMNNNWEYLLYRIYEIIGINYQPFTDKFYREINLKPPEQKLGDEEEEEEKKEEIIEEDIQIDNNNNN